MGVPLTGYQTARLIRSSGHSRVYEAVRESDGRAVIAKVFDLESDDVEPRVEHEFSMIAGLDIDGVVKALSLQRVGEQLVLLLERVPGQNLAEYTQRKPLELERFFSIAIQLSEVIDRIHCRRIVHRDIKPTNILIDPETGRVCLADFGISVLLDAERRNMYDPDVLEGTLPYISPEQTGRTGRAVDVRSDMYSLGVTLYELLTGKRPFEYTAPLELIHAHLARNPAPPEALRADLPDGISRLVMKLLEKPPELRYQTAAGLAADLRKLRELVELGMDGRGLMLGRDDFARSLQLPHQLYGRIAERHELIDELDRIMRTGAPRVMLLTGPPGIGKSALLSDFEGPVAGFGGYLARGKFDAFREQPYAAFTSAFATLVEQLLTEDEDGLEEWREQLNAALGNLAPVVIELVPSFELVLGPQSAVTEQHPHEARNRIHLAISRLLTAFCGEGLPLVVVLDDLHLADPGSLELLRSLLDGVRGALLVLGSYREQAIEPGHPLHELIEELVDQHRVRITRLRPLPLEAVENFLADALTRSSEEVRQLAQIISRKTDCNPLFVRQFLAHLEARGLLRPGQRGWTWDKEAVEAAGIPDDVGEMMTAKLSGLSEEARQLLARGASIGPRFELAELEVVSEGESARLTPMLYKLVEMGLLAELGRYYAFAHDRIRDAAHALLGDEARKRLRWRLGRYMLERREVFEADELFVLVDHLDAGLSEVDMTPEGPLDERGRVELAELNLRAGSRALDAGAHESAERYYALGLALTPTQSEAVARKGQSAAHYQLVVDLHFGRAQVAALSGQHDQADAAFVELLGWELDVSSYGRVAARRVRLLTLNGQMHEAIDVGMGALARCGYKLPRTPGKARMVAAVVRAWLSMRGRRISALMTMPECEDVRVTAAMELITATKNVAYIIDAKLLMLLSGLHIRLFLEHGFHPTCVHALAQLAIGVGPGLGQIEAAISLCEQGIALAERAPETNARVLVESGAYLFVWHLGRPFQEALERLETTYALALEGGDFEYAGYIGALSLSMQLDVGTHLRVLERLSQSTERDIGRWGTLEMVLVVWMIRTFTVRLLGDAKEQGEGEGEDEDERERERLPLTNPEFEQSLDIEGLRARGTSPMSIYAARINLALLDIIFDDPVSAMTHMLEVVDDVEEVMLGSWMVARAALITVLASAGCLALQGTVAPRVHRAQRRGLKLLRRWAKHAPDNFGCYAALASGVHAATRGRANAAMRELEYARSEANRHNNRMVEGLAGERLAELAQREGFVAFAEGARQQAWLAYEAWGAAAKLEAMRTAHPELFERLLALDAADNARSNRSTTMGRRPVDRIEYSAARSGTNTHAEFLDFESVLQAVGSMNEELGLDQVIARVLDAAIANAGADRALLLFERRGVMGVVAEASVSGDHESYRRPLPVNEAGALCPTSLVNFVLRTQQDMVIDDARTDPRFSGDEYVERSGILSLLGMPIIKRGRLIGALVLENRLSAYCFTPERLEALGLIASQAASALDNANLYHALRRSEARWRSLVDGAPDLIALLNERGELEFINRNSVINIEPGQLDGRRLENYLSKESADDWREAVSAVLGEGVQRELEIQREGSDGLRWYIARLAPIEADEEEDGARHAVVIATDVTDRKLAERERERLETQLRQQQRLESIGTLASGVAHEINNPVQGILNYAELIGSNVEDHDIVREFAGEITNESNRVATIVRNLLQFSRQERDERFERAKVSAVIDATLSLIHAVMRKDQIRVSVEVDEGLPEIHCRIQQIQQILMNLVANARDALNELYEGYDERKRIEIRAGLLDRGSTQWVRLTVEDRAAGIPPEVLGRIFDPFFTTKGRDQGTGLGLSVSHGIAQDHGGELSADTRPGEGTRFHLDLPVDPEV